MKLIFKEYFENVDCLKNPFGFIIVLHFEPWSGRYKYFDPAPPSPLPPPPPILPPPPISACLYRLYVGGGGCNNLF